MTESESVALPFGDGPLFNEQIEDVPKGIRTPDPRLRRPLLYPAELLAHDWFQEPKQVMRIELTFSAWKADVLPLNHTCIFY